MLTEKFKTKALEELNETEETRKESLEKLRHWISNHDFFRNCRKGMNIFK